MDDRTSRTLFFYPSIIRVINLQDNPAFYRLTENIEKLIVYRLKDDFTGKDATELKSRLEEHESFDEYATISLQGKKIYFLGKEAPSHSVLIIPAEEEYFIADVMGQIDFFTLSQIIEIMSKEQQNEEPQFLDIFSLMDGGKNNRAQVDPVDSASVELPSDSITTE